MTSPVFVLVHGAWHDARCWDPLVAELAARGRAAVAVTLPSHRPDLGAAAYADSVLAALAARPTGLLSFAARPADTGIGAAASAATGSGGAGSAGAGSGGVGSAGVGPDLAGPVDTGIAVAPSAGVGSGGAGSVEVGLALGPERAGERYVVVGHSLGGLTAPVVAERLGAERVAALVLVAALVPRPGSSSRDLDRSGAGVMADGFGAGQVRGPDGTTSWPPEAAAAELYAGVAAELGDGGADVVAEAVATLRPQAWAVAREITPLTAWPAGPTTVVVCARDRVVDPARLRAAADRLPGAAVVELPTGHFPMLTAPAALADVLVDAGR